MTWKELLDWLKQSNPTDWIQAISSIIAILVAAVSLRISRRSLEVNVKAVVRPIRMNFSGEHPEIELYNSGPGVAYNLKLKMYVLHEDLRRMEEVMPKDSVSGERY